MHKVEFVLDSETSKIHWDFEIQTNHPNPVKRADLVLIYKKKRSSQLVDFIVPVDHGVRIKERENLEKYLDLARKLKKVVEREVAGSTKHG